MSDEHGASDARNYYSLVLLIMQRSLPSVSLLCITYDHNYHLITSTFLHEVVTQLSLIEGPEELLFM